MPTKYQSKMNICVQNHMFVKYCEFFNFLKWWIHKMRLCKEFVFYIFPLVLKKRIASELKHYFSVHITNLIGYTYFHWSITWPLINYQSWTYENKLNIRFEFIVLYLLYLTCHKLICCNFLFNIKILKKFDLA
jgi:hypothetical protein